MIPQVLLVLTPAALKPQVESLMSGEALKLFIGSLRNRLSSIVRQTSTSPHGISHWTYHNLLPENKDMLVSRLKETQRNCDSTLLVPLKSWNIQNVASQCNDYESLPYSWTLTLMLGGVSQCPVALTKKNTRLFLSYSSYWKSWVRT